MAKDKKYEYPYSDEKGRYRYARHKGGNPYRIYEGSKKHIVGGKAIWVRKDQNLADAMLESGQYSKDGKMRESYRRAKKRDENEEQRLYQEAKEKDKEEGYDISHQDKYIDKAIENVDRYSNYTNTKKELEREQYDREDKEFEKGLEKYDDESNKDFLRRGKVQSDYDDGKIGDREYNRRMGELDRKKMERERAEEGSLREKERENKLRREIDEARKKQDDEDDDYGDDFKTPPSLRKKDKTPQDTKVDNWKSMGGFGSYEKKNDDGTSAYIMSGKDVNGNTTFMRTDVNKDGAKHQKVFSSLEEAKKYTPPKTTNETMNNAIREKANKGNTIPRDYEKITYTQKIDTSAGKKGDKFELYKDEDGNTHTKNLRTGETFQANMSMMRSNDAVEINDVVKKQSTPNYNKYSADEQDILDGFGEDYGWDNPDKLQNLKEQIDYMRNPNESLRQTAKRYATGGSGTMLIYTGDAEDYLKERNIKYDKNNPFETYANVMAEKIEKLYNDASNSSVNNAIREKANIKSAYKQYLKDHPESKMSLSEFKKMNK